MNICVYDIASALGCRAEIIDRENRRILTVTSKAVSPDGRREVGMLVVCGPDDDPFPELCRMLCRVIYARTLVERGLLEAPAPSGWMIPILDVSNV